MATLPRGLRNNNPGNIIHSYGNKMLPPYIGEIRPPKDSRFRTFKSIEYGYRALILLLITYIKRGNNTIEKIITTWAPPVENATGSYINSVVNKTGIAKNTIISKTDRNSLIAIAKAISEVENGRPAIESQIIDGYNLINTKTNPSSSTKNYILPIVITIGLIYFLSSNHIINK